MSTFVPERPTSWSTRLSATAQSAEAQALRVARTLRMRAMRAWNLLQGLEAALERRRERRQLRGADDAMLKDIGLPQCGVEWALRHGREIGDDAQRRAGPNPRP
ncbi:MAG TPA: hypothetical protein VGN82_02180 [Bosea sp. (in: a-proteobacteria)]|uniref:hypothetical protein n=1 Tax=Bosea sp. (in: a-proteobacteria) TaxID=1871050 RepID=UPI002E1156C3|nr:hypothetical protein [Bosea sp. (in: a-proteobacteria)]